MRVVTEKKRAAARLNGRKGGAPRTALTREAERLMAKLGCSRQWAYYLLRKEKLNGNFGNYIDNSRK